MARYIGTLLLAALVLWAGEARGACAWVLWEQITLVNFEGKPAIEKGKWTIFAALPTYAECNDAARKRAERHAKPPAEAVNVKDVQMHELIGGGYSVDTALKKPEHASSSREFRCFPDTIDPRGPKAAK